jgi:uncharacterized RDD family membrane protein YckC
MMTNQTSLNGTIIHATFMQRMCAFIVDCLVFIPIYILSNYNIMSIKSLTLSVGISMIWWFYKPLMEWKYGATVGKMALKIRVVDEELKAISLNQAALRFLPYFAVSLSFLFSTFALFRLDGFYEARTVEAFQVLEPEMSRLDTTQLTVFFFIFSCSSIMLDEKKQAIHDRIGKTYCIITKKLRPSSSKDKNEEIPD